MGIPGSANPMLFGGVGAYQINQSLRFDGSAYLNRTPASDTSSNKKGTFSCWMKIGDNSGTNGGTFIGAADNYHYGQFYNQELYFGNASSWVSTAAKHRDPSAWYHVVFAFDTTLATANDRMIIYVNGSRQATGTFNNQPSQNSSFVFLNTTQAYYIGRLLTAYYFNGYIAEVNFIDGTAVTPSSFGETDTITGAWIPKKYTGSYGTNGFYLKFEGSGIGTDSSGNGNTWTANNFSTSGTGTDVMSDTPTNNYATLNPAVRPYPGAEALSDGNLTLTCSSSGVSGSAWGTTLLTTGKWYYEATLTTAGPSNNCVGFSNNTIAAGAGTYTADARTYGWFYQSSGEKTISATTTSYGASYTTGDVIGIALDIDAATITFYKNNTSQGQLTGLSLASGSSGWLAAVEGFNGTVWNVNFGQRAFAYTPPTGFKALNTANLPEPTIKKGGAHFNTVTYSGTGSSQNVTGVGFDPSFTWLKNRNSTYVHYLFDKVRGDGLKLTSNETGAEVAVNQSFITDGFNVNATGLNGSGLTFVAWNWKANGAGSSNTAGTITSTVSANATAGFSIVTYTGNGSNGTVGHGLGVAPKFMIVKSRNNTFSWSIYHKDLGNTRWLEFADTTGYTGSAWNSTDPTSTVFSIGNDAGTNNNTTTYVAYCFSEVAGYSKFGSYTGNGSTDGPFVFCGFRPRWLLVKRSSGIANWYLVDSVRSTYNVIDKALIPDLSNEEETYSNAVDLLSNGFKPRTTGAAFNASGSTYIFAAFSETAFKYSNAR